MSLIDSIKRAIGGYRLGGISINQMSIPPGWNFERYLEIYGQVGWLFGAVSLIANSVAANEWEAYQVKNRKERELIDDHLILDLFDHVNPFQTRYQFLLLAQSYLSLVGEAFIVLEFNRLKVPAQMWLAPPGNMTIVPSSENYISHYEYKTGGITLRFEIPEVIHIMDPNPANPYRGMGAAIAIGTDLDSEYYAARYQQRLFYNDATPGVILEFPDLPPAEERKQLREEFLATHQGWRNARKPAFLWGGAKANTIALAPKDMEYERLRLANKKVILGAYHIPESLIGAADVGSRARAEADEYIFAKYTVKPALIRIREALNEQLCPLFDETLKLDFIDPVPRDVTVERTNNREDFRAGIITREEARVAIGMDAEAESGQTYLVPIALIPEQAKMVKQTSRWSDEQKEAYWRIYVAKTESQERLFHKTLKVLFDEQEKLVLENLQRTPVVNDILFGAREAEERFDKSFKPLIMLVFESSLKDVLEEKHGPRGVAKQDLLNEYALEWIANRSLALAKLVNGTTLAQLRATLAAGFEAGESIDDIAKRVSQYYGDAYTTRSKVLARTEVIAASAEGTIEGYKELGVEKVEWYTALDERVCEICAPLHNTQYAIRESQGMIPAHPQCRCVWLSVEK